MNNNNELISSSAPDTDESTDRLLEESVVHLDDADDEQSDTPLATTDDGVESPISTCCGECCSEQSGTASDAAPQPDVEVVGVRFRPGGKVYYFAPGELKLSKGDGAVVETARGIEYGSVTTANRMVCAKEIVPPLRTVLRKATKEDTARHNANLEKENEAYNVCLEKIEDLRLEMKLVDVEYTFDNSKLLFYFTADGRVDFRDLVKYLASVFRTRIELRQIGIRDEAKMRGGLGICGRPFCCGTFLSDFAQVSIKMAKEQNLSLNSSKISGTCGRLMCCLRYEYDTYVEELARTPKIDSVVTTPDGDGYITEISPLTGICRVKLLATPDAAPQYYHRDNLTFKGIFRKDLPAPPRPAKEEKSESESGNKRSRRALRRSDRPGDENATSQPKSQRSREPKDRKDKQNGNEE